MRSSRLLSFPSTITTTAFPWLYHLLLRILPLIIWLLTTLAHAQEQPMPVALARFATHPNVTYRTNVCHRQQMLFDQSHNNNNSMLRHALQGLNLTVAITNYQVPHEDAFFTLNQTSGAIKETDPGLFVVILDELARRAGFFWRHSYTAVDPLDEQTDAGKTWTDLLLWEVTNFDIAVDYWAKSRERMSLGISFPAGWYNGHIVLATSTHVQATAGSVSLWSFLLPFETAVWFAILAAILVTGLMYFALENLNQQSDERSLERKPLANIYMAAMAFTQHVQFHPATHAARILSLSFTFWALILASAYTANMASFLVSRNEIIFSVSTIDDAITRRTPVCVQRGAVIDEMLSRKYPDLQLVRKESEADMFDALKKSWYGGRGGCGVLVTNLGTFEVYQGQLATNADCSLSSEKRVVSELPAGFATAVDSGIMCTSLISHVLDLHLTEMKAEGFVEQAWQNHLSKISTIDCTDPANMADTDDDTFSLGLEEMGGIFIMHAALSFTALAIAMFQYCYTKWHKPEKKLRPLSFRKALSDQQNCTMPQQQQQQQEQSGGSGRGASNHGGCLGQDHPDSIFAPTEKADCSESLQSSFNDLIGTSHLQQPPPLPLMQGEPRTLSFSANESLQEVQC